MATVKKVNQYKCDFCGKKKYSAPAIIKHEKHCTMNPDRHCRMCDELYGGTSTELRELTEFVPINLYIALDKLKNYQFPLVSSDDDYESFVELQKVALEIYKASGECPMCTLAALRQSKIPVHESIFDYKEKRKEALQIVSENKRNEY